MEMRYPFKSRVGMDAAGVPGFVDGVLTAHEKWGKPSSGKSFLLQ